MGWTVHVIPVTTFAAVCSDEFACPGPRTKADGAKHDGQWTGPERSTHDEAQRDADEHWRAHDRRYYEINSAADPENYPPLAPTGVEP